MKEVLINGQRISGMGVTLLEGSYASLLTPPELKEWVSNDDPRKDGVEYIIPPQIAVKERNVNLYFLIRGSSQVDFLSKYNAFVELLQAGIIDVRVDDLQRSFRLKYEACTSFDHFNLTMCKLAVKFIEPQPLNLTTTAIVIEE